jgi:hypothetical protein
MPLGTIVVTAEAGPGTTTKSKGEPGSGLFV